MPAPLAPPHPPAVAQVPLDRFTDRVFSHLPRADQRHWAQSYLRGLLTTPGRKSLQSMARAVCDSPTASQCLQQFVNSSPWDWRPARRELAQAVAEAAPVRAWVATTAITPKRGDHAVGVHRRFVPEAGRTLKCQAAAGLFLSADRHAVPVDWRLVLNHDWCQEPERRTRARLPASIAPGPASALVPDMARRLGQLLPAAPLVADLGCAGEPAALAGELTAAGIDFLIAIRPGQLVLPSPARTATPLPVRTAAGAPERPRTVRGGTRAEDLVGPAPALRPPGSVTRSTMVRLPAADGGSTPAYRLWALGPATGPHAGGYWLTSLRGAGPATVLRLLDHLSTTRAALADMEQDFGLQDFEGRSYPGWHHHTTMVCAAYTFHRLHHSPTTPGPPLP
ncbi:hypothetical protein GXW83_17800 [Streptacidiphilus sp. PB12-B1b]|uniref:IS701 family transposase n=1 Tax=Streptacidiphilus sp. PB12-B1b TaxID=2705012 RepID=UPI0015F980C8|nr:transposase [Streptacidiphilus sp. PB12-B1b]QMU77273.1 hypothetical protein GXW83_17800 [Streptacidiphilus sp. PB12-B1b]